MWCDRTEAFGKRDTTGLVWIIWIGEVIFVNQFKRAELTV